MNTAKDMAVHLREEHIVRIFDDADAGDNVLIAGNDHPLDDFYVKSARLMCGEVCDTGKFVKVQLKQGGNALSDVVGCTQGTNLVGSVVRFTIDSAYNPVPAGVDLLAVLTEDTTNLDGGMVLYVDGYYVEAA